MFSLRQATDTDGYHASTRNRVASFVLALVTSALVFVIMIRMGAFTQFGEPGGARLVAIDLGTEAEKGAKDSAQREKAEQKSDSAAAKPQTAPVVPPRVPIPGKVQWPEGFIELSSKDYAAADITKMKRGSGSGDAGGGRRECWRRRRGRRAGRCAALQCAMVSRTDRRRDGPLHAPQSHARRMGDDRLPHDREIPRRGLPGTG